MPPALRDAAAMACAESSATKTPATIQSGGHGIHEGLERPFGLLGSLLQRDGLGQEGRQLPLFRQECAGLLWGQVQFFFAQCRQVARITLGFHKQRIKFFPLDAM